MYPQPSLHHILLALAGNSQSPCPKGCPAAHSPCLRGAWVQGGEQGAGCGVQVALASSQQLPAHGSSLSHPAPWGHAAPMPNAHHPTGTTCMCHTGTWHTSSPCIGTCQAHWPPESPGSSQKPLCFQGASPPSPTLLGPSSSPGGVEPYPLSAPRPCWALSGPALSWGRCCSSLKGPEVCRDPTPDSGVTWGTAPQLGRLGDSAKVTEPARGEGRPLIFLTPNKPSPLREGSQGLGSGWQGMEGQGGQAERELLEAKHQAGTGPGCSGC